MPFSVRPYSNFSEAISFCDKGEFFGNGLDAQQSTRIKYLDDYLKVLKAKTVIIEHEYVDRNFIDDYCGYYSKCFRDYPKKCERLLFFNKIFSDQDLKEAVLSTSDNDLRKDIERSFLGYIVMRPISGAHLGKVCLSTYPNQENRIRNFPLNKRYFAHFMGLNLSIDTVAFQEQDNVISACATSSIWSALHCIRDFNPDDVPSPYEITESAKRIHVHSEPTKTIEKGLYPSQMTAVIENQHLNPILLSFKSKSILKAIVRAYMNVGVPVMLGMELAYQDEDRNIRNSGTYLIGEHAVTITGYHLQSGKLPEAFSEDDFSDDPFNDVFDIYFVSSLIDKFYVHDDQIGPFASMEDEHEYWQRLHTRWNHYVDKDNPVDATVNIILIPCFKKIRIHFFNIFDIIKNINSKIVHSLKAFNASPLWDARIFCVNDFKEAIRNRTLYPNLSDDERLDLLSMKLPRYFWAVDLDLYDNDENRRINAINLLLDATDMESSNYLLCCKFYEEPIFRLLSENLKYMTLAEFDVYINGMNKNRAILRSLFGYLRDGKFKSIFKP